MLKYKEIYNYEQYKSAQELQKETSKDGRGPGRIGPQTGLPLIHDATDAQL